MDSFTLNTTTAYDFVIFDGSVATNKLSTASLHLSILQHRNNWRASSLIVDPDDYEVAKLYFKYWRTTDSAWLHFDLSWFSMDPKQQTNCPRRALIFRFYNKATIEPPVWLLNVTTTKSLSLISIIDGLLTLPGCISIWVDFRWIMSKEKIVGGEPSSFGSTT